MELDVFHSLDFGYFNVFFVFYIFIHLVWKCREELFVKNHVFFGFSMFVKCTMRVFQFGDVIGLAFRFTFYLAEQLFFFCCSQLQFWQLLDFLHDIHSLWALFQFFYGSSSLFEIFMLRRFYFTDFHIFVSILFRIMSNPPFQSFINPWFIPIDSFNSSSLYNNVDQLFFFLDLGQ